MDSEKIKEHFCKEYLKSVVDNNYNYTEKQKLDLKLIIDNGKTPNEIIEAMLVYFAFPI